MSAKLKEKKYIVTKTCRGGVTKVSVNDVGVVLCR